MNMKTVVLFYLPGLAMVSAMQTAIIDTIDGTLNERIKISIPNSKIENEFFEVREDSARIAMDRENVRENNRFFLGKTADSKSTVNLMKVDNPEELTRETYFASIVNETSGIVYQISPGPDGDMIVKETKSTDFGEEIDPIEDEEVANLSKKKDKKEDVFDRQTMAIEDDGSFLDVMVVWTKKSECSVSSQSKGCQFTSTTEANIRTLIDLAVTETNVAYTSSGVQTQLRLVHAYRHPDFDEDTSDFSTSLTQLRLTTDGVMDDVHDKREEHKADIVALIVDLPQYCGIARMGPSIESMFSVTKYSCATGYFSFGHEIGHNLGCYHDRGTEGVCNEQNYNYGYRDPQAEFRSILAYSCVSGQCDGNAGGGCTRVQKFSNDEFLHNNKPIGNAFSDNARRINDVRVTVARYYESNFGQPTSSPVVTISPAPTKTPTSAPTENRCCPSGKFPFKLEVLTDFWPAETSWEITKDDDGSIVDTNPALGSSTLYEEDYCLDNGCYTFTIFDTYGDGICCSFGQGHFKGYLYRSESSYFQGGQFGSSDSKAFCGVDQCSAPTPSPTASPTKSPTSSPTLNPTPSPTRNPTSSPTQSPTSNPTQSPTSSPTRSPTSSPTQSPTRNPTPNPTSNPTQRPTPRPTQSPTRNPTPSPTANPTQSPTSSPTQNPTPSPTQSPTQNPTPNPTSNPTQSPIPIPSPNPTPSPTQNPTPNPTPRPNRSPTPSPTTSSPVQNPTSSPTQDPTPSPTQNPTPSPTPSPSGTPTKFPTTHPNNDPWLIYNTFIESELNSIFVSHDINSGPQDAEIQLFEGDCASELEENEIVDVIFGPDVVISDNITYALRLDESKLGSSEVVTFDNDANTSGTINFCSKLNTMTADDLIVASKKIKFNVHFDMSNVAFTIDDIAIAENDAQEVAVGMQFSAFACECDEAFQCVSNVYVQGSSAPEFRVCITPTNEELSISNMEVKLSRNGFDYEPVRFGEGGAETDSLTIINQSGSTKMVQTRIVEGLFSGSEEAFMSVSGACLLQLASGKSDIGRTEFYPFDLKITVQVLEHDSEGGEKNGCLQKLLSRFMKR